MAAEKSNKESSTPSIDANISLQIETGDGKFKKTDEDVKVKLKIAFNDSQTYDGVIDIFPSEYNAVLKMFNDMLLRS